jgi:hypothetical protein
MRDFYNEVNRNDQFPPKLLFIPYQLAPHGAVQPLTRSKIIILNRVALYGTIKETTEGYRGLEPEINPKLIGIA